MNNANLVSIALTNKQILDTMSRYEYGLYVRLVGINGIEQPTALRIATVGPFPGMPELIFDDGHERLVFKCLAVDRREEYQRDLIEFNKRKS